MVFLMYLPSRAPTAHYFNVNPGQILSALTLSSLTLGAAVTLVTLVTFCLILFDPIFLDPEIVEYLREFETIFEKTLPSYQWSRGRCLMKKP
jgi:hypothetical protein